MKIEFTREEYKCLLDMIYIAEWILNAHKVGDDPRTKEYGKLEQKVYSYAKEMGFEDLIEYVVDHGQYFPTKVYEDAGSATKFVDEFEDETFWDELINRLAERDLIKQLGGTENLSKLSFEERIERILELEKKYSSEFEKNGLDNVSIVSNKRKK